MDNKEIITLIIPLIAPVLAFLQAFLMYRLTTAKPNKKSNQLDILIGAISPIHCLLFYQSISLTREEMLRKIDEIIKKHYFLFSPLLIDLFRNAKEDSARNSGALKIFKEAIDANYNYYKKVVGLPNRRLHSAWRYLDSKIKIRIFIYYVMIIIAITLSIGFFILLILSTAHREVLNITFFGLYIFIICAVINIAFSCIKS